ncbi:ABC transporter substrate-binding protein/permease [Woeseiaceae bacterium]|nr:ABC transporter substrate-binding protein/permease [Woeseiaceae bacterium]
MLLLPMDLYSKDINNNIIVGANIGNVPWEFQDSDGSYIGFEIDLVNKVGEQLKRKIKIINIPFNGLFAAVQSGRVDLAISSINITEKRLESVSFTQPYYDSDQSLTVLNNSKIKNLYDLKGMIVAVDTGSTGDIWATENNEKYEFGEIRRYEGLVPAMLDLVIGRVAGYISDIPALLYYTKDKPNLEVVERMPTGGLYSMMLRKNNSLLFEVNDVLIEMKRSGELNELHKKWFGKFAAKNSSTIKILDIPKSSGKLNLNLTETFLNKRVFLETYPMLINGFYITIQLGLLSILLGLIWGLLLSLIRLYSNAFLRFLVKTYINVFRSIPLLVFLIIVFYAFPFVGIRFSPFNAALFSLVIVSGAYFAEIFRSGIEAIPKGQFEAAKALGLSPYHTMVDIILPQAIKIVIPPLTNNCINVLKDTALASIVALPDLLKQATQAQAIAANPTPLIVSAFIYLIFLLPMILWVSRIEKRYRSGKQL